MRDRDAVTVALWATAVLIVAAVVTWIGGAGASPAAGVTTVALAVAVAFPGARRLLGRPRRRLPATVAGRPIARDTSLRVRTAVTVGASVLLPVAALAPLVLLVPAGWALADIALIFVLAGAASGRAQDRRELASVPAGPDVTGALQRLCLRADIPAPPAMVHDSDTPAAWSARDTVHVTRGLVATLPASQLEAVLAHELVHVARGDALAMEVVGKVPRDLLTGLRAMLGTEVDEATGYAQSVATFLGAAIALPAFALAGVNALLAAGLARARELSADATAVVITGNPSALGAALLAIDNGGRLAGEPALRRRSPICIVALSWSTAPGTRSHPRVEDRVRRLTEIEARLQA